jgi:NADPH2:quinone reductase
VIFFGQASGAPDPIQPRRLLGSRTLTTASLFDYARTREDLMALAGPVMATTADGTLRARIDRVFPLEDAVLAHQLLEGRRTMGKLLLST